jgi:peptide/nickel transport system permease protein
MAVTPSRASAPSVIVTAPFAHTGRWLQQLAALQIPWISASVLLLVLVCAIFAPLLAPYDPTEISLLQARQPPFTSVAHPLGTDTLGRDMVSRLIYGARYTMSISIATLAVATIVGCVLGLVAGWMGGTGDRVIMRVTDAVLGFPSILSAMLVMVIFGQGVQNVVLAIAISTWPRIARMLRVEVLRYRERDFVLFAKIAGTSVPIILWRHLVPNVFGTMVVVVTITASQVILLEASLSFLGLGLPPGSPSWGIMVAEGRQGLRDTWWLSLFPGLAIASVVMGINFFGDWLRDILDPKLRRSIAPGVKLPRSQRRIAA